MTLGKLKKIIDKAFDEYGDKPCDIDFLDEINVIEPWPGCECSGDVIGKIKLNDDED